jgi:hypothetical protein
MVMSDHDKNGDGSGLMTDAAKADPAVPFAPVQSGPAEDPPPPDPGVEMPIPGRSDLDD